MSPPAAANGPFESFDLKAALNIVQHVDPASALFGRCRALLADSLEKPRPKPSGNKERKLLTIGMATANDYDGSYFTIQTIRLFHPEILNDVEFLLVDNDPTGPCAASLRDLGSWCKNYRYIPYGTTQGTAVRDLVFREAAGDFVLCVDSHVLFPPGSLARLLDYCARNPESIDLLQGPLISDAMEPIATHFEDRWSAGMYGQWGMDERGKDLDGPPFEIVMQGLGVFGCRREAWPGFNPRLSGFGGEEGYIHEKIRRAGGRNLCLPFLRWMHRFHRPMGVPYRCIVEDRVRNYLLIHDELALDPTPALGHFEELIGKDTVKNIVRSVQAELAGPFHFFDGIYCISLDHRSEQWSAMLRRFRELGIERKVRRFPAASTPLNQNIGRVLSHRRIVAEARQQRMNAVVVFDEEGVFSPETADELKANLGDLKDGEWQLCFPGGSAIAFHHSIYDAVLSAIPDDAIQVARLAGWLDLDCPDAMQQVLHAMVSDAAAATVPIQ